LNKKEINMNIYNFINQKYTEWKKTGKSPIKFVEFPKKPDPKVPSPK